MSVRLGEILVKESLITQDQLQKALEFQRTNGGKLGSCLTKLGIITDDDMTGVLSRQYGVPTINLMKDLVDEDNELELAAEEAELDAASLEKAAEEAPIIKLVNLILTDSVKRGASDIHLEPYELEMRVRFRIDGQLQTVMTPPLKLKDAITSRIKIMAKLDIAEKRLPQDGR